MGVFESGTGTRPAVPPLAHEEEAGGSRRVHPSLRAHLANSRTALAVITLAVVAMFLPVATVSYGQVDDYVFMWMAVSGHPDPLAGESLFITSAVQARPLEGLLDSWAFSAAGSIDNLRFLRLLAILGIAAFAVLLHWALVRAGFRSAPAALIVVLVCCLPAFQVFAALAVAWSTPLAAILGGGASLVGASAFDVPGRIRTGRVVASGAMLLAAILIYPPPAMFFWVFLAIAVIASRYDPARVKRMVWGHLGIAVVAFALTWAITRLAIHVYGADAPNAGRSTLVHDIGGKLRWFLGWRSAHETGLSIHDPLFGSLSLFELTPTRWFSGLVAVVAIAGILVLLLRERLSIPLFGGIAVVLVPLTFSASLVVEENSPGFRLQTAMTALIALYFSLGAYGLWLFVRDRLAPRLSGRGLRAVDLLATAAAFTFVAIGAFAATRNSIKFFVLPQSTELRLLRSQVAGIPAGTQRLGFVQTGNNQGMTGFISVDEVGVPSSARPWVLRPLALLLLHEQGKLSVHEPEPIIDILPPSTSSYPSGEAVIDVRGLIRLR